MSEKTKRRLERLELSVPDWTSRLGYVDYLGDDDYSNEDWTELHHEDGITVYQHVESGEIRGVYEERRSDNEIKDAGGNLAFL